MEHFLEECETMWKHLEQRHKVQFDELNKECEPLRRLKPKFSPEMLRMMVSIAVQSDSCSACFAQIVCGLLSVSKDKTVLVCMHDHV